MTPRFDILPVARADIQRIANRLGRERSGLGRRFLAAFRRDCDRVARMPGIGEPLGLLDGRHPDLRVASITKFRNFLFFYRPIHSGIEVVRVRHGAMDAESLLQHEAEGPE